MGAPARSVARCAMRWVVRSRARLDRVSASTRSIVVFSRVVRYELMIGLRYTRAKRRNRFISFISLISMVGIALRVSVLIVVLSVMNGFQTEVRTRILGVASHLILTGANGIVGDWKSVASSATEHPKVVAAAPFIQ